MEEEAITYVRLTSDAARQRHAEDPAWAGAARTLWPAGLAVLGALVLMLAIVAPASAADSDGDGLRDGFERRWGVTDPNKRDSDGDGVIDSAEDDDRDRLSNLGEQRFGTDPGNPDTDGDGTLDSAEDKNRNGISNAREQDRRRLPPGLRPSLAGSLRDVPPRNSSCIPTGRSSQLRPCVFGKKYAKTKIVIFGDSHAFQWVPALDAVGKRVGWRVTSLTKGSCKSAWLNHGKPAKTPCARWRMSAFRWLRRHSPDLVILANAAPALGKTRKDWQASLEATIKTLPRRSKVLILSDTPRPDKNAAICLASHPNDMSACTFTRGSAFRARVLADDKAVAEATRATQSSLFSKVCPYGPCPLVQGDKLIYRGVHHITATISRQLAPSVRAVVTAALREPAPADVATADVAEADIAATDIAETAVAEADIAEADIAATDIAETAVAEAGVDADLAETDGEQLLSQPQTTS